MLDISYFEKSNLFTEHNISVKGIRVFININQLTYAIFYGRRSKHTFYQSSRTIDKLFFEVDKLVKAQYDVNFEKESQKIENKVNAIKARSNIKVGDIFHTSWGYDQTNVDFFQVIDKPTKAKVLIRPIDNILCYSHTTSGYVVPKKDTFIGEQKLCLVNALGHLVKADDYGHYAYPTSPNTSYFVSWDR